MTKIFFSTYSDYMNLYVISSVQSLSCVWLFVTPWIAACQGSLSITNSRSLLKLMSIVSVMPCNHLILCRPLLLPPSIFPSIRVSSNELVLCITWPKYWSFSFSISPYKGWFPLELTGLISLQSKEVQESSPTLMLELMFKCINSSALSFLCSPTLTSIHDYWKNHSFD